MRIALTAFAAAAVAAVTAMTPSVSAKNSDAQKGEDKAASSCSAYQQASDGSWVQLPCKESGERSQTQTQHQPAAQSGDQEAR